MKMLVSKIIIECLVEQGVDTIFGYPGGQNIPIYDALYDYVQKGKIKHILTAHEQGATHAADGYARSSGKPGVVLVTSGPGATNTVTGIATAYIDSIPMIVLTGQVPTNLIGKDAFQEVDIIGCTLPIVKHSFTISNPSEVKDIMRKAFKIATSKRPGPVLIDIPKDITIVESDYKRITKEDKEKLSKEFSKKPSIDKEKVKEIARLINNSKRPVIYAGGGVSSSGATKELNELVNKASIPTGTTLMALGTLSRESEYSLGIVGMHGGKDANLAFHNSDLIITLGARFSDRVTGNPKTFGRKSKVIQVDIDYSEVDKNIYSDYTIIADVKEFLKLLLPYIKKVKRSSYISEIKSNHIKTGSNKGLAPNTVFKTIMECFKDKKKDVIVATDVGQHQMWTAQKWMFEKPRKFITSGGLGTMGFGLGAAIGAKLANKDKPVILFTGDGSFRMNLNELATVSSLNLPILIFVLDNSVLGMVRQWQKLFFNKRYSETSLSDVIDYESLAKGFMLEASIIKNLSELESEVTRAIKENKARIFRIKISKDENVWPIVPPGDSIENQVITEF